MANGITASFQIKAYDCKPCFLTAPKSVRPRSRPILDCPLHPLRPPTNRRPRLRGLGRRSHPTHARSYQLTPPSNSDSVPGSSLLPAPTAMTLSMSYARLFSTPIWTAVACHRFPSGVAWPLAPYRALQSGSKLPPGVWPPSGILPPRIPKGFRPLARGWAAFSRTYPGGQGLR